jgi:hypothetical protein
MSAVALEKSLLRSVIGVPETPEEIATARATDTSLPPTATGTLKSTAERFPLVKLERVFVLPPTTICPAELVATAFDTSNFVVLLSDTEVVCVGKAAEPTRELVGTAFSVRASKMVRRYVKEETAEETPCG